MSPIRWTLGSVLFLCSFAAMMGPVAYVQHLASGPRLPFTAAYFGSIGLTLYFAIGVSQQQCSPGYAEPHPGTGAPCVESVHANTPHSFGVPSSRFPAPSSKSLPLYGTSLATSPWARLACGSLRRLARAGPLPGFQADAGKRTCFLRLDPTGRYQHIACMPR